MAYHLDDTSLDGASSQPSRAPGGARRYFRGENAALGLEGTEVPAWILDMLVNELVNAVQASGLTLDKSADNQLAAAIARMARQRSRIRVAATSIALDLVTDLGGLIRCTAAPLTLSLPAAAAAENGWTCRVTSAAASGYITVAAAGSDLIQGLPAVSIAPGEEASLTTDGAGWWITRRARIDLGEVTVTAGAASALIAPPADLLPAVTRIDLWLRGVALSGTDRPIIQLGTGSPVTWTTSGYTGQMSITQDQQSGGGGNSTSAHAAGFLAGSAGNQLPAVTHIQLRQCAGRIWHYEQVITPRPAAGTAGYLGHSAGFVTLAAPLTAIRLVPAGSNTVSAGLLAAEAWV